MAAFSDDIDATFEAFGEPVTWTPAGGAAVPGVLAIPYVDDAGPATGHGSRRKRTRFEVRKSQVGTERPSNGSELLDAAGIRHSVKDAEDKPALALWLLTTEQVG